jgi:hypothetical protein
MAREPQANRAGRPGVTMTTNAIGPQGHPGRVLSSAHDARGHDDDAGVGPGALTAALTKPRGERSGAFAFPGHLPAYRISGLVEARVGRGTFVRSRPPGPPPGIHSRPSRGLARWVAEARDAGLDDETIEELLRVTLRAADEEETA